MKNTITLACALCSLGSVTLESRADFTPPGFLFRVFESGVASGGVKSARDSRVTDPKEIKAQTTVIVFFISLFLLKSEDLL